MKLRDYQIDAVNAAINSLNEDQYKGLLQMLVLPTASGKNLVGSKIAINFILEHGYKVIWIAPDRELINQAIKTIQAVTSDNAGRSIIVKEYGDNLRGDIFVTTAHKFYRSNLQRLERHRERLLVIVDEVHWGINRSMFKHSSQFCNKPGKKPIPILGMTATPRAPNHIPYRIIYQKSYAELAMKGYLATPTINNVMTGYCWEPRFNGIGQLTPPSLEALNAPDRNNIVIQTVLSSLRDTHKKGILFAANIAHAEALYQELKEHIRCSVVHGKRPKTNEEMIKKFRSGESSLMIVVNKFIQGFDDPEITDVFLVRPCESEVLLSQMVGRGARIISGKKDSFTVHDFYDAIDDNKVSKIFHADGLFADAKPWRPRQHNYSYQPKRVNLDQTFGNLAGLEFMVNQTFGVELEITCKGAIPGFNSDAWSKVAKILIDALMSALGPESVYQQGLPYHGSARANALCLWRLESDSSVGWEVISPILVGVEGLKELIKVCNVLHELIDNHDLLHINYRCGLHLTLATNLTTVEKRKQFLALVARLEPGLLTLVAPSRLYSFDPATSGYVLVKNNQYCKPWCADPDELQEIMERPQQMELIDNRYHSVNLNKITDIHHLVEIRLHNGTVDVNKIVPWICLWMAIIKNSPERQFNPRPLFPNNIVELKNIFTLLNNERIVISNKLTELLFERRKQLSERWKTVLPNYYSQWCSSGWYDPESIIPRARRA